MKSEPDELSFLIQKDYPKLSQEEREELAEQLVGYMEAVVRIYESAMHDPERRKRLQELLD